MTKPSVRALAHLSRSTLLAALLAFAGCGGDRAVPNSPDRAAEAVGAPASAPVLEMEDPGIATAIAAQKKATPGLLRKSGIIGTGVSVDARGKPVVVVYAEHPGARVPRDVEGIPTLTLVTGPVIAYVKPGSGSLHMGTSAGNDGECGAGTLGCVVVKGGVDYFLSNNHVFARENAASSGERIDAPGRYDSRPSCAQTPQCATLSEWEPIRFNGPVNVIDAALARPVPGRAYTSAAVSGYDPTSTVVAPAVGMSVKKTGRTTRLTRGRIQAVNVTIVVGYGAGFAWFEGQIQMPGNFIRPGDSGSLMVTESGDNPVGLCFAGSQAASFANPIGPVLERFGATVK